ncbi:MAG TPA: hypothetical protein VNT60_11670 [Deinococcales bacterium]|nr:hypothetical protein [Deinococcales bacterium]
MRVSPDDPLFPSASPADGGDADAARRLPDPPRRRWTVPEVRSRRRHHPPETAPPAAREAAAPGPPLAARDAVAAVLVPDLPAWAAHAADPGLDDATVIVLDGGRVLGMDRAAREAGVRPGDARGRARALCPEAALVPHDAPRVQAAWENAVSLAYTRTPFLDPARPGLMYAGQLSREEAEGLVLDLRASVGLAQSRGTALLAALRAGGEHALSIADEAGFLEAVSTSVLAGAGVPAWVVERLELFGLRTLGQVARLTPRQLTAQFGQDARRVLELARGEDRASVALYRAPDEPEARYEFELPALEPAEWDPVLRHLLEEAAGKLGERLARTLTVGVKTAAGEATARRVLREPAREARALLTPAALALTEAVTPGEEVLALRVTLGGVFRPVPTQASLFAVLQRPGVRAAVDLVEGRFPGLLGRMQVVDEAAYLPEQRFRFLPLADAPSEPPARRGGKKGVRQLAG